MSATQPGLARRPSSGPLDAGPSPAAPPASRTGDAALLALCGESVPGPAPEADPDPVVSAWRAIAASHAAASCALERELGSRHGLGVSEFEVLDRLAESNEHKFRAQELAEAVHLSQSALSRLIDRLEKHGLVERCLCGTDRRGIFVVLTQDGRKRHAEAAPTHRDVLASVLPARLVTR